MKVVNREFNAGADKAQRILEAAKGLFSSVGLKNTSIEDIAAKAGLGKGTVYLYFKSKEEIFTTLATSFHKDLHSAIDDACNTPATPTEKLRAYIETRIRFWERSYNEYGLTVKSLFEAMSTPASAAMRAHYAGDDMNLIKNILESGISSGEFCFANASRTAMALYSMLDALSLPWDQDGKRVSSDEMVKSYSSLLLNGLNVR